MGEPEPDPDAPEESGPLRTCAATRARLAPEAMIRFVLAPDGMVTPDIRRRLPGRGVWVTARADCVRLALKRQVFSRHLRPRAAAKGETVKITAAADLDAGADALLLADALQALSLANKAGAVTSGFAKVEAAIAGEPVAALLNAVDGAEDGARKLRQAARRLTESGGACPEINIFSSAQMDLALGRTNVIHAAILQKPAGAGFVSRALKLLAYRTAPAAPEHGPPRQPPEFRSGE